MATIDSREVIEALLAGHGHYEGDPPCAVIVRYTTPEGNETHGVTWAGRYEDVERYLRPSQYVRNPVEVFRHDAAACPTCLEARS